jgi:hypothetical protein
MANNHTQFIAFNGTIAISKAKKDTLTGNRKTLREVIKKYFKDNKKAIDPDCGGKFECYRPTTPTDEDLFKNYSDTKRDYFLSQLDSFVKSAKEAIEGTNPKESCEKWQKHFGDRFSCSSAIDENEAKEKAKALVEGTLNIVQQRAYLLQLALQWRLQKVFMAIFNKKKQANPLVQIGVMKSKFPQFQSKQKGDNIVFTGTLLIKRELPIYNVSVEYRGNLRPVVRVNSPALVEKPPHTFADKSLCLYHSDNFKWSSDKLIAREIMQWTVAWIYFYEYWLQTSKWVGPEMTHNLGKKDE